jgi:hypothetical protein
LSKLKISQIIDIAPSSSYTKGPSQSIEERHYVTERTVRWCSNKKSLLYSVVLDTDPLIHSLRIAAYTHKKKRITTPNFMYLLTELFTNQTPAEFVKSRLKYFYDSKGIFREADYSLAQKITDLTKHLVELSSDDTLHDYAGQFWFKRQQDKDNIYAFAINPDLKPKDKDGTLVFSSLDSFLGNIQSTANVTTNNPKTLDVKTRGKSPTLRPSIIYRGCTPAAVSDTIVKPTLRPGKVVKGKKKIDYLAKDYSYKTAGSNSYYDQKQNRVREQRMADQQKCYIDENLFEDDELFNLDYQ